MAINRDSRGRFTSNTRTNNTSNWFKNAAKSLGYSGVELLKTTMPTMTETIDLNKEFATNIVSTLRANKNTKKFGNIEQQLSGKALENWRDIKTGISNAKEDFRSGKFYNPERRQKVADDWGLEDFDLDDGFSFDVSDELDDSNFDDNESPTVVAPNITINSNIDKNNPMVAAVRQQTQMLADNEIMASKRSIAIAESSMKLDRELANVLYGGIETVNSNLGILVNFNNEQVSGYIGASLKYYEESIQHISTISEAIKSIAGNLNKPQEDTREDPFDNIFGAEGGFNVSEYLKLVKKQFGNTIDNDFLLGSIKSMLETDGIKAIAQAPLEFIPNFIVNKLVPEFLTSSLKSLDKSFKSVIPALFNKMSSWADEISMNDMGMGYIKGFIGNILGIKTPNKRTIDPSNYEKGVVPFDGITRKSIVEVIPGYLSKILSALTGKDELIFDSDKGTFHTKTEINKEYRSKYRQSILSGYSDVLSDLRDRVSAFDGDQAEITSDLEELLIKITESGKMFNPHDNEAFSNLLSNSRHEKEIRALLNSLSPSQMMELVGANYYEARKGRTRFIENMEKSGNMLGISQVNNLFGDTADYLKNNPNLNTFTYYDESKTKRIGGSIFTPSDRYGKNSLNYLRDIYTTLLRGIGVYKIKPSRDLLNRHGAMEAADLANDRSNMPLSTSSLKSKSEEDIARDREQGFGIISEDDIHTLDNAELVERIRHSMDSRYSKPTEAQSKNFTLSKLMKVIFGSKSERSEVIQEATDDFVGKIASGFKNIITGIDNSLYRLVFGEDPVGMPGHKKGLFSEMGNSVKRWLFGEKDEDGVPKGGIFGKVREFGNYLKEKFFTPIKEAFIGENGVITKFKQSEFYKNLKDSISKTGTKLFGTRDESGNRSGGKLSDIYNKTTGEMKSFGTSFKNNIREWLFGSDVDKTKEEAKGVLTDVGNYFKEGFQGFTDAIFGKSFNTKTQENESKVLVSDITTKLKDNAPKAIAGGIIGGGVGLLSGIGGFGLLGSLFLGPMSGVVLGTATALLSQSDKFKNWLFGKKDDNGDRIGGFISKSTQEFFKEHKGAIIGGTALGMLKGITGIGILPSFILGGPITGALFGLGASLLTKSEAFQNMLFGKIDEEGTRSGGVIGKVTNAVNSDDVKRKLGFAGAGAVLGGIGGSALSSFGILGSIAFGPLSGAILGAGAGIALAANKWKDAIFGKFDEKTGEKTEQGILSKMMAAVTVEVLQPAKVKALEWRNNVIDWFEEKIAEPFLSSLDPIREELSRMKDRVVDFGYTILEKLHVPGLFQSIGDKLYLGFKSITNTLGKFIGESAKLVTKYTAKLIQSPFTLINFIADKILLPKHMREGIASVRAQIIDNIKNSDFVKNIVTPITDTVKGTIAEVKTYTFKAIKGTLSFFGKAALEMLKGVGRAAVGIIAAPFKLGANLVKGTVDLVKNIRGLNKGTDSDRMSDIIKGNRGFGESVLDLISLGFGGSLRNSAKLGGFSDEDIRDRIIRRAEENGESLSEDDIAKRIKEFRRKNPEGATYQNDRLSAKERRAEERANRKKLRDDALKSMQGKLRSNQQLARALDYNLLSEEERNALSFDDFNKSIDKLNKDMYGKEWKNMTPIQRKEFDNREASTKATVGSFNLLEKIAGWVKDIATGNAKIRVTDKDRTPEEKAAEVTKDIIDDTLIPGPLARREDIIRAREKARKDKNNAIMQKGLLHRGYRRLTGNNLDDDLSNISSWLTGESSNKTNSMRPTEDKQYHLEHSTLGETAAEQIKENEEKAEKERQYSVFEKMLGIMKDSNDEDKKHNKLWDFIFSKKGLLTVGIISGLALLSGKLNDVIKSIGSGAAELFGFKDSNKDRTNSVGQTQVNSDAVESAATLGLKYGAKGIQIAKSSFDNISKSFSSVGKAFTDLTGGAKYNVKDIASAMGTTTDDVAEVLGKGKKFSADDIAKGFGTTADDVASHLGNTQTTLIDDFVKMLKNAFTKLTKNLSGKFAKVADNKIFKVLSTAISKITGSGASKKLVKFAPKIATFFGKVGAAASTLLASDAAWAIYGGVTGSAKSETANLFGISEDRVDAQMRMASSIIKGFFSISWFAIFPIASDISVALGGPDFIRLLAQVVYSLIVGGDSEKVQALQDSQTSFEAAYDEYTKMQEYLKGNATINPDGSITINDASNIESFDSYNDRMNKSVMSKITGGIGSVLGTAKDFLFGQSGDSTANADAKAQLAELEKLASEGIVSKDSANYIETKRSIEDKIDDTETKYGLFSPIIGGFKYLMGGFKNVGYFIKGLGVRFKGVWDKHIAEPLNNTIDGIGDWWNENVSEPFNKNVTEPINEKLTQLKNWWNDDVVTPVTNTIDDVKDWWKNSVTEPFKENVLNPIKELTGVITDGVSGFFGGIVNWVKETIDLGKGGELDADSGTSSSIRNNTSTKGAEELLAQYKITSNFQPARTINGVTSPHRGVDLAKGVNTPIYSFTDGTVHKVVSGYSPNSGYYGSKDGGGWGNYVLVKDKKGNYNYYAHLNGTSVKEGQTISRGSQLGIQGHTGNSTGSHLHYEVRQGNLDRTSAIDPLNYLKKYTSTNSIDPSENTNVDTTSGTSGTATSNSQFSSSNTNTNTSNLTGIAGLTAKLTGAFNSLLAPLTNLISNVSSAASSAGITSGSVNNATDAPSNADGTVATPGSWDTSSAYTDVSSSGTNAETIYRFLRSKGVTHAGAAGMLGVWEAESGLNPTNVENGYENIVGNDSAYTKNTNTYNVWPEYGKSGYDYYNKRPLSDLKDHVGYGLAQWTHSTRKDKLLQYAKSNNKSIGDLGMQLNYAWQELNNGNAEYAKVLQRVTTTDNPEDAALGMLVDYEMPGWNDSKGLSSSFWPARRQNANKWFTKFKSLDTQDKQKSTTSGAERANVDDGGVGGEHYTINDRPMLPGYKKYNKKPIKDILNIGGPNEPTTDARIFEFLIKIVDALQSINNNTRDTATNTNDIKNKESTTTNNTAVVDNSQNTTNSPMYEIASKQRSNKISKGYKTAKLLAAGTH